MKLLSLTIVLYLSFNGFGQPDSTITGIDFTCQTIDSKGDISLFAFRDKDSLPPDKFGYANVNYSCKIENKSKSILYIKVNRDNENWYDQFYFQNGNLIKAVITKYPPSSPTTIFYLWNSNLIAQIPDAPLYWKAFNQLGYCAFEKVKDYNSRRTFK